MKKDFTFFKKILVSCRPSKRDLLFMAIVFSSFLMIFVAGSFNAKTKVEQIACELSKAVNNDEETYILCKSETKKMTDGERFSKYVNDQFYEVTPFKSIIGYNFEKTIDCTFSELGNTGSNLSFLTSTYFTNHIVDDKIVFDRYYCTLLFKETSASRDGDVSNFLYITKTQADFLILNNDSFNTYADILNTTMSLKINGEHSTVWKIANIIDDSGLFCDFSKKVFNNYVFCFTLVPEELRATQSMLLSMSNSTYSNVNFISLIEANFNYEDYYFTEIENGTKATNNLVNYLNSRNSNSILNVMSILMIVLFSSPFFALAYFGLKFGITINNIVEFFVTSLMAWLLFFIIYSITNSVLFFSFVSLATFIAIFLAFFFWMLIVWLIKNYEVQIKSI